MNRRSVFRAARTVRALLAMVMAAAGLTAAAPLAGAQPTFSDDPAVIESQNRLDEARARAAEMAGRLDTAAAAYENANAHHLRLVEEVAGTGERIDEAEAHVDVAHREFAERIAAAYRRPDMAVALAEAVILAPDAATVLHRSALLGRMTERALAPVDLAEGVHDRIVDEVRQHHVIEAGSLAAAAERQRLADDLTVTLGQARHAVEEAERAVAAAREAAEARAAEEERRRQAEFAAASGIAPLPPIDGKVCPLGAPNGFIDSWGFPRSGGRRHQGVDMFAAYGMPVFAVADGTVLRAYNNRLGGLSIDLLDDRGDRYYYAHLSAAHVAGGQRVVAGQVIGSNGDSGNARGTPPHLHWQYHPGNGPPVNPFPLAHRLCRAG